MKAFVRGKRAVLVSDNPRLKAWRERVKQAAVEAAGGRRFRKDAALRLSMDFVLPRPKTVTREHPTVPPDADKLYRAIGDAISDSGVWADDAQVVDGHPTKRYGEPGVHIEIREVGT